MPVSTADAYMQAMSSGGNMTASDVYRDLMSSGGPYPSSSGHRVGDLIFTPGGSRGLGSGLTVPAPVDDRRMYVYPTTYYPAAASVDQAAVVKLASGDERSGADLQLKLVPGVRVSGMVTGPDGPVKNTGVKLYAVGVEALNGVFQNLESSSTVTDGSGAFTFLGVTPGQYTLKVIRVPRPIQPASAPSNMTSIEVSGPGGQMMMGVSMSGPGSVGPPLPLPPDPTLWASTSVNVADRDLDGIAVALRAGIRVSGRLQFEGTKTPPGPDQLQRATVMLTSSTETRVFGAVAPGSRVESDGRFHTQGFTPGRYQITASIPAAGASSAGWTLKSAMLEGRNLTDDPLALESDDVSGVVITFTDQTTQLVGSVVNSRGQPDKTAEVIVFPADSQSWRQGVTNARRIRTARASSAGNYELSNLPPGEYFAIAVSDDASGDTQDPKYLESLIGGTTRVTLADGEKKVQNLVSRGARQ
jgi:hypothetical protein